MSENHEKYALMWHENIDRLKAVDAHTMQHEYEQALSLCAELHPHLSSSLDSDEYIQFLSLYADIVALHNNIDKEIDIQEEIVNIRHRQSEANGGECDGKLANSLLYAAMLHRKAVNVHKSIEYMEQYHLCQQKIEEKNPGANSLNVVLATFRLADTYAHFGRNILAEEYYIDAIMLADELRNNDPANETSHSMLLGELLIEIGNFYFKDNMINEAIDRYIQSIDTLRPYEKVNDGAATLLQSLYQQLHNIYAAIGNNKRAEYYNALIKQPNK